MKEIRLRAVDVRIAPGSEQIIFGHFHFFGQVGDSMSIISRKRGQF